jgi:NAD-dependent dihydropyrimidine dehydrogenase PreA subunit
MIAHYGYADGSGEYYIIIDTDRCDGCEECVKVCPQGVFEVALDDYDKAVARVKEDVVKSIHYVCLGYHRRCANEENNCHAVCSQDAISHTW